MQSKAIILKLKKLEKKVYKEHDLFVFFNIPTPLQLSLLPPNAKIVVIAGEDEIED